MDSFTKIFTGVVAVMNRHCGMHEYRLNGCFTMTSFVARVVQLQVSPATRSSMPLRKDG
jgi:hypothetical protein